MGVERATDNPTALTQFSQSDPVLSCTFLPTPLLFVKSAAATTGYVKLANDI